jgi:hypothetical protein
MFASLHCKQQCTITKRCIRIREIGFLNFFLMTAEIFRRNAIDMRASSAHFLCSLCCYWGAMGGAEITFAIHRVVSLALTFE